MPDEFYEYLYRKAAGVKAKMPESKPESDDSCLDDDRDDGGYDCNEDV